MRSIVLIGLFILFSSTQHSNLIGKYSDHFGHSIKLLPNSTFEFYYQFDLAASWSNGVWNISNDTIYLKYVPVMDTLIIRDSENNILKDSLVLSIDPDANRIESDEYFVALLSAYGQNKLPPPEKLFLKNGKLFRFNEDGTLDNKRVKQFWTRKKYKTCFYRID